MSHQKIYKIATDYEITVNDFGHILTIPKYNKSFIINEFIAEFIQIWKQSENLEEAKNKLNLGDSSNDEIISIISQNLFNALIDDTSNIDLKKNRDQYIKFKCNLLSEKSTALFCIILYPLFHRTVFISTSILLIFLLFYNYLIIDKSIIYDSFSFYLITFFISTIFHELGHASSLYKYTKKSCTIGCGIYLLNLVLYTDVTNVWKLKKAQRLIVNFGGLYFEMIMLTLLLAANLFFRFNPTHLLFIYLLRFIYTLDPLYRSDGYWIVSDFFAIHNLTERLNEELKNVFIKFNKPSNYWLLTYAVISKIYIAYFLAYIIIESSIRDLLLYPKNLYLIISNSPHDIFTFLQENILISFLYALVFGFLLKILTLKKIKLNYTRS
ncbi:hypothetical protein [Flavobacterium lipolyticum]|uniref:Peptide zinc metalloprotease protein n=1 Tax=Flavobacterium lipolyticum TaxID=2893754 RepID=A0ABS8LUG4_9FLAO|nr:hypothetical protein [Flavobacterium sp. F-126]MCC9016211.1 hypothetical protein [Flavobacterium sp. F-126]